jgi:hypothetical protein
LRADLPNDSGVVTKRGTLLEKRQRKWRWPALTTAAAFVPK